MIEVPKDHGAVVYCIENTNNHKKYIGSTLDLYSRISTHKSQLKRGKHNIKDMQADYDSGDDFVVSVLYRSDKKDYLEQKGDVAINEYKEIINNNAVENGYNRASFKPYFLRAQFDKICKKYNITLDDAIRML